MNVSLRMQKVVALVLLCCAILLLFVVAPVLAQDAPAGIPSMALEKYICVGDVGSTGSSVPTSCVHPGSENAANVPVVSPGGTISFIYAVTYVCTGAQDCPPIDDPATVTITDDQLPGVKPTVYGQFQGNNDAHFDRGEIWGYVVNSRTAINLSTQGGTLPKPPVTGCAAAPDGVGARPTYKNIAFVVTPYTSESSSTYYCNPLSASITIKKYTNGQDADTPTGPEIQEGKDVNWTYEVANNGAATLTNVSVTDNQGVAVSCPKNTLAPGETMICTGAGKAVHGQYANIGTVVGTTPTGSTVTASNPSHYFGVSKPTPKSTPKPVPIPEPVTVVLFGTGLAALSAAVATRRKKND